MIFFVPTDLNEMNLTDKVRYDTWQFVKIHTLFMADFCRFQTKYLVQNLNEGITLTGYHLPPPQANPRATIFSFKILASGTAFQYRTPAPGSRKRNKIPTPGHNLRSSNAKISMKKEHNSIRAVSFQIFHNCPFDNFPLS